MNGLPDNPRAHELVSALFWLFPCALLIACGRQSAVEVSPTSPVEVVSDGADTSSRVDTAVAVKPIHAQGAAIESRLVRNRRAQHDKVLDPTSDGWKSEAFSGQVQQIIDKFASLALSGKGYTAAELAPILTDDFVCSPIRPRQLTTVFNDGQFVVKRPNQAGQSGNQPLKGVAGAVAAMAEWSDSLTANQPATIQTKTVGVTSTQNGVQTLHFIEASAARGDRFVEQHCTWTCEWRVNPVSQKPQLSSLRALDYEEATVANPLFSDQTARVIGESKAYRDQLSKGLNHWLDQIETTHGMYVFAEYGITVGDVNGDEYEDVYICQPGGLPNRLFVRSHDGEMVDHSAASGADWLDHTSCALLVDFDNDGDQDLALAVESKKVIFMQNDGTGVFSVGTEVPIADRHVQSLAAADFDNDGKVDVYLTVGFADEKARTERAPAFVYHDANEGGANVLMRNSCSASDWAFNDVTKQVGLDENNRRHSLAAAWEDFDNDGDQDLYVANDYGQNCFYENRNGTFHDIAAKVGLVDYGSGMSVSWSDYDHDGQMDLYVGNMFSSAGNRITRQAAFQSQVSPEARSILTRFAKGNSLFRNQGNGRFEEMGSEAGVELGRWAWSSLFCDINNDGNDDIVIANGYVTNDDERDL